MREFIRNELKGWKVWEILWIVVATAVITILSVYWGDNARGIVMASTGVICVVLTGKGKMSCFIFGLVNTVLYAWISFEAKYYGEVMLNALYYVPMQFVGWYLWKTHLNEDTQEVEKSRLSIKQDIFLLCAAVGVIWIYGLLLKLLGGNLPFIDSLSTSLSVVAMILSVRRLMEQWVLWIIVDLATIYMWAVDYMNGGTDIATLLMWCVYLLNAVVMLIKWYRASKEVCEYAV